MDIFYVFSGGLCEFSRDHANLCETLIKETEHRPLYSPTTPALIEPAIETAIANQILPFLYLGKSKTSPSVHLTHA